jgi:hypothetical protein
MKQFILPIPKVGDDIYVPSAFYLSHGVDDVVGGLGKVIKVKEGISCGETTYFVYVAEHENKGYNWEFLAKQQEDLKKQFGNERAYPDPDYSPSSNTWN